MKKDITVRIPVKVNNITKKQRSNIEKHLRIAKATYGDEKRKHLEIADKLLTRYGL